MVIFYQLLNRVMEVPNILDYLIFVSKVYIPDLRPLVPFLVEKFVVAGGWGVAGVKSGF